MHTSFFGQLESYKNTKKGETGMSEKEKGPLEECQKREKPKDAKKGGPRHARGEGGGPKKKEDPGMSEKEKNRSQGSLKNVASTVRSAVNYVERRTHKYERRPEIQQWAPEIQIQCSSPPSKVLCCQI